MSGALNLAWAQALVAGFAAAGVTEAVLSPGARSSPLALALLRRPEIRCHVLIDERAAAFFALGLARATGRAPLLLATSGSAPAHWLPAVVEADLDALPLLLLAADRPQELVGWGANQTADQAHWFAGMARAAHRLPPPEADFRVESLHALAARAVAESTWPLPGPVHLNLPFREPLLPAEAEAAPPLPAAIPFHAPHALPDPQAIAALAAECAGQPGVILVGGDAYAPEFAPAVAALAQALGAPLLAEPLSGLRCGLRGGPAAESICTRQEAFLRRRAFTTAQRPRWVLRFGAWPVSRSVQNWLLGLDADVTLVDTAGRWRDPERRAARVVAADPARFCDSLRAAVPAPAPAPADWLAVWQAEEARAERLARTAIDAAPLFEGALWRAAFAALPAGANLFCGSSMAIRDFDAFSATRALPLACHGQRGASGIDGHVATVGGIAAARGTTLGIVGDVAAAHDLGGFAALRGQPATLLIMDNGGGGIFEYLPPAALPEFERAWLTPPRVDFAAAAATHGIDYRRIGSAAELAEWLATPPAGPRVLHAVIDRAASVAAHRAYWDAVAAD